MPLLANCTFIKSGIRVFDGPRFIGSAEIAKIMIKELDSSAALLLRGSGLVTVAENIQEATLLSILIERSAKIQYMASAIGAPRPIAADEMPGKFGTMPTHFLNLPGGTTFRKQSSRCRAALDSIQSGRSRTRHGSSAAVR